jgi:hypothetical protein
VLERSPLRFGDGLVHVGGQVSRRDMDRPFYEAQELAAQVVVDFIDISLNQIVQSGDPGRDPLEGLLTGRFTVAGNPREPEQLFGTGSVAIDRSDLLNFRPLAVLYTALGRWDDRREPTGSGTADLRFGAGALEIRNVSYFNRGVEVLAEMSIENLWDAGESPLSGIATGTGRPLRDVRLPFFRDVDQVLDVLQRELTTVQITGTLREPDGQLIPFAEVGDALRSLLSSEVQRRRR